MPVPLLLLLSPVVPAGVAGGVEFVVTVPDGVRVTETGAEIDVVFDVLLPLVLPPLVPPSSFGVPLCVVGWVGLCVGCEDGCELGCAVDAGGESLFVP